MFITFVIIIQVFECYNWNKIFNIFILKYLCYLERLYFHLLTIDNGTVHKETLKKKATMYMFKSMYAALFMCKIANKNKEISESTQHLMMLPSFW